MRLIIKISPTRRHALTTIVLAPLTLRLHAQPQSTKVNVEGQWFDRSIQVAGTELLLNGVGVRAAGWFKGYAAGLYLRANASTAAQALGMDGPKRLQLRMLVDVDTVEFMKAVHKGVARNSTARELPALQGRLAEFERRILALEKVRRGDIIDLDLEPGRGLQMRVNGVLRGAPLPGDDFYAAVLRSFVGEDPYDDKLKAGLLGRLK